MGTETNAAANKDNLTLPLMFDIIGPVAVHLQQPDRYEAIIYAPLCEDHHANLLTDQQDVSLCGATPPPTPDQCATEPPVTGWKDFSYTLSGPEPSTGSSLCDPDRPRELLRVKCSDPLGALGKYHLKMTVPLPNKILSLRPEQVWIHANDSSRWLTSGCQDDPNVNPDYKCMVKSVRARGLRFIYDTCQGQPKLTLNTPFPRDYPICATTRGIGSGGIITPHYSMMLRYAALHSSSESDGFDPYADAYSCFQHLRTLVPALSQWRADFVAPASSGSVIIPRDNSGPNPHDCLSPNLIVQNGDDPS